MATKEFNVSIGADTSDFSKGVKEAEKDIDGLGQSASDSEAEVNKAFERMKMQFETTGGSLKKYSSTQMKAKTKMLGYLNSLDDLTLKEKYLHGRYSMSNDAMDQRAEKIKLNSRLVKLQTTAQQKQLDMMDKLAERGVTAEQYLARASSPKLAQQQLEHFKSMGGALNKINSLHLKNLSAVENTISNWSGVKMAIAKSNGDLKKAYMLNRSITQFTGAMSTGWMALGIAIGGFYYILGKTAFATHESLQKSFETLKANMLKAFKPMLDIMAMIMQGVINFTNKIFEMMIAFNKANPTLAKFIQGVVMMIPILTALMLPLAMGIGLLSGWKVVINMVFTALKPMIMVLGSVSASVLVVAVVIGALIVAMVHLWKTNEDFRNAVLDIWKAIQKGITSVLNGIKNAMNSNGGELKTLIQSVWNGIKTIIQGVLNIIVGIVQVFSGILNGNWKTVWNGIKNITNGFVSILSGIAKVIMNAIASAIVGAAHLISGGFKTVFNGAKNIISGFISGFTSIGRQLMQGLANGVKSGASAVLSSIKGAVQGAINKAKALLNIHSPSKVFKEIGAYTTQGFSIGIEKEERKVLTATSGMTDTAIQGASLNSIKPISNGNTGNTSVVFNMSVGNVGSEQDMQKLVRMIDVKLKEFENRNRKTRGVASIV